MTTEKTALPVLLDSGKIQRRVAELGVEITAGYPASDPLYLIGVLKGSFVFLADLIRAMPRPVRVDFIGASSYGDGTVSSGEVTLTKELSVDISGCDVVVVEDIVDTGITLKYLLENVAGRNPKSLRVASLLSKPERRQVEVPVDYIGFSIPNKFVVGYGLDNAEDYRDLPDICIGG